jgi:WD40 repeat protein
MMAIACDDDIRVISRSGDLVAILSVCAPPVGCSGPNWSPGGDAIAFYRGVFRSGPQPNSNGIYWVDTACLDQPSECPSSIHGPVGGVDPFAWGPEPRQMAIARGARIDIVDVTTGTIQGTLPATWTNISTLAWSPDGETIAYEANGNVHLLAVDTGHELVIQEAVDRYLAGWLTFGEAEDQR